MKKILISFLIILSLLALPKNSYALNQLRQEIRRTIQEGKKTGSNPAEIRQEVRQEIKENNQGLLDKIKNKIKNLHFGARITGTISSINDGALTITGEDGKSYRVNVTDKTQLRRRFWGKSQLSEFSHGDKVNVIGRWTDENKISIDAVLIRNLSIQKRWGVFFGEIMSKQDGLFVIKSLNRGDQTVVVTTGIKYINRKEQTINYTDLQVSHRIRVKGIWDKTLNKIIEVEQIKDFSLPPIPIKSISPTGSL